MMKTIFKISFFSIALLLFKSNSWAQSNGLEPIILDMVIVGDDTLPAITLQPVEIRPKISAGPILDNKMKYHARKAYPYAIRVARIVHEIDAELTRLDGRRPEKKYLNSTEKLLKDEFKDDLKDLTRTQGRILIKLVERETGLTVHDLISLYRSDVKAGWWQFLAKRFDLDIKDTMDEEGEDAALETYIQELDEIYQRTGKKKQIENEELDLSVQGKKRERRRNSTE